MDKPLEPLTAREALLELRRILSRTLPSDFGLALRHLDNVAKAGLDRSEPPNFELTDQLADRLAEAHAVLRDLIDNGTGVRRKPGWTEEVERKVAHALILPPDLETMVERRIGHA